MRKLTEEFIEILKEKEIVFDIDEIDATEAVGGYDLVTADFVGKYENAYRLYVEINDEYCQSTVKYFTGISKETAEKVMPEIVKLNDEYLMKFSMRESDDGTYFLYISHMMYLNERSAADDIYECSAVLVDLVDTAYKRILPFID